MYRRCDGRCDERHFGNARRDKVNGDPECALSRQFPHSHLLHRWHRGRCCLRRRKARSPRTTAVTAALRSCARYIAIMAMMAGMITTTTANTKITPPKAKANATTNAVGRKSVPLLSSSASTILAVAPALVRAPVQPSARASVISASSQAVRPWATPATALHRLPAHRVAAARVLRAAQAGIRSRTAPAQRSSRTEETTGWRRLRANPSITPAAVVERTHRRGLNASGFSCRAERAGRPQVDVAQAPHQPVFVPTDRHCPLVARQQTRGVCNAASVLHGPSGTPGT